MLRVLPVEEGQLSAISDEPGVVWRGVGRAVAGPARGSPGFPRSGDGACSNVGSGCTGNDRLALMVGTSGAMRVLWKAESVEIPDGPWCYRADAERYVMGGALSDGGNLIEWLRNTLRLPDPERDGEIAVRDGAGLPRPHVPAPARRRAWTGMGRQGQRDRRRALDEHQAGRDPARRDGGRGLQVRALSRRCSSPLLPGRRRSSPAAGASSTRRRGPGSWPTP